MPKVKKSIRIDAPVEEVFAFMSNPVNFPEVWSSLVEMSDVKTKPDGRFSFNWVYKMGGIKFTGSGECIEVLPNKRVVMENKKEIPSKFVWIYDSEGAGTRVTMEVDYTIPISLINKIAEKIIIKLNEQEADNLLLNLKARMEG